MDQVDGTEVNVEQQLEAGSQEPQAEAAQPQNAELERELEVARRMLAEEKDKSLRLLAEFENFKRRALKEQSELLKYQGEKVVVDMLEVLDNLELALAHSSAEYEKLKQGLDMIHKMFVERLGKWEIRGETGVGQTFDPQKHSAISRVPAQNGQPPGTIIGELKKAFYYKDKLIRPGEVVVVSEPQ